MSSSKFKRVIATTLSITLLLQPFITSFISIDLIQAQEEPVQTEEAPAVSEPVVEQSVEPEPVVEEVQESAPQSEPVQEEPVVEEPVLEEVAETESEPFVEENLVEEEAEEPEVDEAVEPVAEELAQEIAETQEIGVEEARTLEGEKEVFYNIQAGVLYTYSLNSQVTIRFNSLPAGNHQFSIQRVSVVSGDGYVDGYDFQTDMVDGTFTYDLTLPNELGINAQVKYSEDGVNFYDVSNEVQLGNQVAVAADHFTIFTVEYDSVQGLWAPTGFVDNDTVVTIPEEFVISGSGGFNQSATAPCIAVSTGNANHYINPGATGRFFTWYFDVPTTGQYYVYVQSVEHDNRTSAAPFTVDSEDPTTTINIDQRTPGVASCSAGTDLLGIFNFNSATTYSVQTHGVAGGYVSGDGIRLIQVEAGPTVTAVNTATADGKYGVGQIIDITVQFSEAVDVTGTPRLILNTTPTAYANYFSGSGTDTLVFRYTIGAGEETLDLDYGSIAALELNGGVIEDSSGNPANLTLPVITLAAAHAISVDGVAPVLSAFAMYSAAIGGGGTDIYNNPAYMNGGRIIVGGNDVQICADYTDNQILTNVIGYIAGQGFFSNADFSPFPTNNHSWLPVAQGTYCITWDTEALTGGVPALADGNYDVGLNARDMSGGLTGGSQLNDIEMISITVDNTFPTFTVNNGVETGPVLSDTVNVTVSDTNLLEAKYAFSPDATCDNTDSYSNTLTSGADFTISDESQNGMYLCLYAMDMAGNATYELADIDAFNIDITAPVIPGNPGWGTSTPPVGYQGDGLGVSDFVACGGYINTIEPWYGMWGEATDSGSGLNTYQRDVVYNGSYVGTFSSGINYAGPFTPFVGTGANGGEGVYYVRVRAIDNLGNRSIDDVTWGNKVPDGTWCMATIDLTAPAAPVPLSPADGIAIQGIAFTQTWTSVPDAVVYHYESCKVDTGDAGAVCSIVRFTNDYFTPSKFVAAGQPNGRFWWRLSAEDAAGNVSSFGPNFEMIIDNDEPVVDVDTYTPDPTNDNTPTFTGNVEDFPTEDNPVTFAEDDYPSGVVSVEYRILNAGDLSVVIDWTAANATDGTFDSANEAFNLTTSTLLDGTYIIEVMATDRAGNVTEGDSDTFTIDTEKPWVDPLLVNDTFFEGDTIPAIEITGNDTLEISQVCFDITYTPTGTNTNGNLPYSDCLNVVGAPLTMYTWNLTDIANNAGLTNFDTSLIPEGIYTIDYWVLDTAGNRSDEDNDPLNGDQDYTVDFTLENVEPSLVISSDQIIDEGGTAVFSASFSDPSDVDNGDATFDDAQWTGTIDYGDGTVIDLGAFNTFNSPGSITIPDHVYANNGVYTVTLEICEANAVGSEFECNTLINNTVTVTVNNVAPDVTSLLANPGTINEGGTVSFTGAFTDPGDEGTWDVLVDYGDGNTTSFTVSSTGAISIPSHIYTTAGNYTVTLTVTDPDGGSDSATAAVNVTVADTSVSVVLAGNAPATNSGTGIVFVTAGVNFTITASILASNPGNAPYDYVFGNICTGSAIDTGSTFTSNVLNLPAGTYSCLVTATDADGDVSVSGVFIQVSGPVVAGVGVGAGDVLGQSTTNTPQTTNNDNDEEEDGDILGEEDDAQTCDETFTLSGTVTNDEEDGVRAIKIRVYYFDDNGNRKLLRVTNTDNDGEWNAEACPGRYEIELDETTLPDNFELNGDNLVTRVLGEEDLEGIDFEITPVEGGEESDSNDFNLMWLLIPLALIFLLGLLFFVTRKSSDENDRY